MSKHAGSIVKRATLIAALVAMSTPFADAAEAAGGTCPLVTTVQRTQPPLPARTDTTFHPNYDSALSVGQMSAAWQAELDRLFPQPVTGGG